MSCIHCIKSDFRSARVIALFQYLGLPFSLNFLDKKTYTNDEEFKKISVFGESPVFQTSNDKFSGDKTIIRYISRKYKDF